MEKYKYRVKMCKFLGTPSEVLITKPFDINVHSTSNLQVGTEISDFIGVVKYQKTIDVSLNGDTKGAFPPFIPRTDEPNFQAVPDLFTTIYGKPYYVTLKYDGTSSTYYHKDGEVGVCSRTWEKKMEDVSNIYSFVNAKYKVTDKLKATGKNLAVQGEIIGPKVQKNPLGVKEPTLKVFDVWDIDNQRYFSQEQLLEFCKSNDLEAVDVISIGIWEDSAPDFDDVRKIGEVRYPNGVWAEGVVVRVPTEEGIGRVSFKIINLNYKQ
jgi:RNA ligase (TIGR02306 family)